MGLAGYGYLPIEFPGGDVVLVAGWNEKVFDIISSVEAGASVVDVINNMDL